MDPSQPDFLYPHTRQSLFYKHEKPIFLLKAALMPHHIFTEDMDQLNVSDHQIDEARKNLPKIVRFGEQKFTKYLKQGLSDMERLGFDFLYSCDDSLLDYFPKKIKYLDRPHQHMQMTCKKCSLKYKDKMFGKREDRWTTSKGTLQIKYAVIKITEFNKKVPKSKQISDYKHFRTPYIVVFQPKIYSMHCQRLQCKAWAEVLLYEPWVNFICEKFCLYVWESIGNIPAENWKSLPFKRLKKHRKKQCEACKLKVCDKSREK